MTRMTAPDISSPRPPSQIARRFKRVASVVLALFATFLGLLLVTFIIGRVVPIDPVLAVIGERASQAQYEAAREALGLDKPMWQQFGIYVWNALQGDLGQSLLTRRPVAEDIARVFPATLELATIATIFGILAGIPAGVLAATRPGSWIDQLVRLIGLMGYSMPVFWLGLMGLLLFYGMLGWVGGPGRLDAVHEMMFELEVRRVTGMILIDTALAGQWEMFRNAVSHIILPAGVLGYYSMAYISRMTRSFMMNELSQEYITTARVKGMPEWRVVWVHALKNVMVPLITVIALSYANLLEGSVLTETVFAWPGLGLYITNALFSADMPAVLGGTVVVGLVFVGLNMFSDVLYRLVDPRAK
ncbi:peptide/nickel transport system permease protein [Gemmobacter megaterium]|uniref:Peptide/nickel transport system permease protein n=2 Tax=Gemmobacter megaterium TaxID=1086013 RepID=A0A1N7JXQ6_9RHOB|nr:ABC transporter permease [Gemmobacter megaterium]GGD99535.1 peptide ABC transporter permease [Gemmobacter megaterium]SIS54125.1 peptide/nickel transport system permease protein [Gemmobacter megaterium]